MLVFITYLLISGHIRGQGAGPLGHGGQYTDFGHACGVALDGHDLGAEEGEVVAWVVGGGAEDGVGWGLLVATTMVGGGGGEAVLTTRTHLGLAEVVLAGHDAKVSCG